MSLPVSVIVVTKNEEKRLGKCLVALSAFDDVWVVDSRSGDATCQVAAGYGARLEDYIWNGAYPKKRGWCLDYLPTKYDWVLFVDADEVMTDDLVAEIAALSFEDETVAGYFVRGRYVWNDQVLRYGLHNNKIALLHKKRMEFPVVDDLGLPGMGELEGHYQPVRKTGFENARIEQLSSPLLHDAGLSWEARHRRYALWEAAMNERGAWPEDPVKLRALAKALFRALPFRSAAAFVQSYIFRFGFMDGAAGLDFAKARARYYRMISDASKDLALVS